MRLAAACLVIALSGCVFGDGCWDDGGTASWHEPGAYAELASRPGTVPLAPAEGVPSPSAQADEAFGDGTLLSDLAWAHDGPRIRMDLTQEPPLFSVWSFEQEDPRDAARPFLAMVAPDADADAVLAGMSQDHGRKGFYVAEVAFPLDLEGAFTWGDVEHGGAGRATVTGGDLAWSFRFPAVEVPHDGMYLVRADSSDHIFVDLLANPSSTGDARQLAVQRLAGLNLTASPGEDFRFDAQQVCT